MVTDQLNKLSRLYSDGKLNRETYLSKRRTLINEMVAVEDVPKAVPIEPPVPPQIEVKTEKLFNLAYVAIPFIIAVIAVVVLMMPSSEVPQVVEKDTIIQPEAQEPLVEAFNSYAKDGEIEISEMVQLVKDWQNASQNSKNELISFIDSVSLDRSFTADVLPFDELTEVRSNLLSLDGTLVDKLSTIVSPDTTNENREELFDELIDDYDFASDEERLKLKHYISLYLDLWDGDFDKEYETSLLYEVKDFLLFEPANIGKETIVSNSSPAQDEKNEQSIIVPSENASDYKETVSDTNVVDNLAATETSETTQQNTQSGFNEPSDVAPKKVVPAKTAESKVAKVETIKEESIEKQVSKEKIEENNAPAVANVLSSDVKKTEASVSSETLENLSPYDVAMKGLNQVMDLTSLNSQTVLEEFFSFYRQSKNSIPEAERKKLREEKRNPVLESIGTHPNFRNHYEHLNEWSSQLANENSEENLKLRRWVTNVLKVFNAANNYNSKE